MIVAVIPARGGSKRIPDKNIRLFSGKPMIAHSIGVALESGLFDRIIVSTDSPQIAEIAAEWGAEAPFMRPAELANDTAVIDDVFLHGLKCLAEAGELYDFACLIFATAPFLQARYLEEGLTLLQAEGATSAVSVTTFPFPIFRGLKIDTAGRLAMFWPEHQFSRSQDLPEALHDAGQFCWADVPKYETVRSLLADAVPVVIPRRLVQDIDTIEDWECAEMMAKII